MGTCETAQKRSDIPFFNADDWEPFQTRNNIGIPAFGAFRVGDLNIADVLFSPAKRDCSDAADREAVAAGICVCHANGASLRYPVPLLMMTLAFITRQGRSFFPAVSVRCAWPIAKRSLFGHHHVPAQELHLHGGLQA